MQKTQNWAPLNVAQAVARPAKVWRLLTFGGVFFVKEGMFTPRRFKVMEALANGTGSHLRFRGRWLLEAGFSPGASFEVSSPETGTLLLKVHNPAPLTDKDFREAITRLENAVNRATDCNSKSA